METSNRITLFAHVLKFLLIIGIFLVCGTAMGQTKQKKKSGESAFTLQPITVTAEFYKTTVQKTPLSITAISANQLEMRDQTNLVQVALEAPNVSLRPGNATYGSSMIAYIRGIGQTDFNPSVEPGVGVYVDDVYYSTITGNLLDLLDLSRVEILRGPQGTLAGRNALGGAIKLFTKKPDGSGEGYFQMTFGSLHRLDIKGAADFAITDKLFMRVAGTSRSKDGYITSYDYACYNHTPAYGSPGGVPSFLTLGDSSCELAKEGGQSMTAGRIALRYLPSDKLEINFSTNLVNDNSNSQPSVLYSARNMATISGGIPIFFDNNHNGVYDPGIDVPYDSRFVTAGTYMNYANYMDTGLNTPDPTLQGGQPGKNINLYKPISMPRINHLKTRDYTLTFDWQINDKNSLKSITAYRKYMNVFADDDDGSPLAVQQLLQRMRHHQFTQELRLNSKLFNGFADTTVGVFYLNQTTTEDARVDLNYVAFDFLHGPDAVPATSEAVYGQSIFHLPYNSNLTLGVRYSKDKKSYYFHRHNPDGSTIQPFDPSILYLGLFPYPFDANQPANSLLASLNGLSVSYKSSHFDYRVALDHSLTKNIMVYGLVSTGYRAGGNNARPFYPSQVNTFGPETLTNYELGMKSILFKQLRFNWSAFYDNYKDIQLPLSACYFAPAGEQSPCAAQDNVGSAHVYGVEVEGTWKPTRAFSLDFSYAFLDFKYTHIKKYIDAQGNLVPVSSADVTPYTPKNKWNVGAQYRFDFGKYGDLTYRLDYSYRSSVETVAITGQGAKIAGYALVNGRATWRSPDLKWQASLECTNFFNKYYYLTIFDLEDANGSIFRNAQPGPPQEWAFTIKRIWYFQ